MNRTLHTTCALMAGLGLYLPLVAQSQPVRDLKEFVCATTLPSGKQRLLFVDAQDKQAARRLADRVPMADGPGKKVAARSVQECIEPGREKFIDPKAAEMLASTPR